MESKAIADLLKICGRSDRTKCRDQVLRPLLDAGLLEITIPDKLQAGDRTTAAGKQRLEQES